MQSKDNTCPDCGWPFWHKEHQLRKSRDYEHGMPSSGQQEDKPTIKLGDQTWYKDGVRPTDSKPGKPQYWACVDHAIGGDESTADGRCAGCRAVGVPADYQPPGTASLESILEHHFSFSKSGYGIEQLDEAIAALNAYVEERVATELKTTLKFVQQENMDLLDDSMTEYLTARITELEAKHE